MIHELATKRGHQVGSRTAEIHYHPDNDLQVFDFFAILTH